MLHTVEVGSARGDLIAAMSNMMSWLSTHGLQAVMFQQRNGDATIFRLGFSSEAEALAFVCAFGGRLIRPEMRDCCCRFSKLSKSRSVVRTDIRHRTTTSTR